MLGEMTMGVAGVAMLGILVFLYKSIQSIVLFFIWKNKINTVGTIKVLKNKKFNFTNDKKEKISSIDYVYEMEINESGKDYTVEYIVPVSGDKSSKIQINQSIPVYFDLDKMQVRAMDKLKKDIWQYPLGILMCVAILVICLIIVTAIG